MVRIAERRSALPTGPILAAHVRHDGDAEPAVFAHSRGFRSACVRRRLSRTEEGFLQALAYAERAGLTVIWIDDPGGCSRRRNAQFEMWASNIKAAKRSA